jgi:acyl-CoA reductase-like NAD-dependent aldehyde dehydrogenase
MVFYQFFVSVTINKVGLGDDSKGYFVQPTIILTKDPQSVTMVEEIFGPVITVRTFLPDRLDII